MEYEKTIVETKVYLEPENVNDNYEAYLLSKLRQNLEKSANESIGIIKSIDAIENVKDSRIMENSTFIIFTVEVKIERYMPNVNDVLNIFITKLTSYGIFYAEEQIRILIPNTYMPEHYVLEKDNNSFVLKNTKNEMIYTDGDLLSIKINEIKFEKNGFSCLAHIVEK
jgi:DNA-directed RNA polymerase subunit E'/Rpb7